MSKTRVLCVHHRQLKTRGGTLFQPRTDPTPPFLPLQLPYGNRYLLYSFSWWDRAKLRRPHKCERQSWDRVPGMVAVAIPVMVTVTVTVTALTLVPTRRFSGLMSRWMTCFWWQYSRAFASDRMYCNPLLPRSVLPPSHTPARRLQVVHMSSPWPSVAPRRSCSAAVLCTAPPGRRTRG